MIGRLLAWLYRQPTIIAPVEDERHIARRVRSRRQHQSYADRRAAECRAARLRFEESK